MASAFGQASNYTFVEMKGDGSSQLPGGYSVVLGGRALPYRPYEVSGEMRAESTAYPGNPIKTLQMLGAIENETTITGWWKDRFIKSTDAFGLPVVSGPPGIAMVNGVQVFDSMSLAKAIDLIRRRGQLVEVAWDEITRHGYLKKFAQKWHRREDLEWEITWDWISQGEKQSPVAFATEFSRADLESVLSTQLANLAAAANPVFLLSEVFTNQLTSFTGLISDAVDDIGNASLTLVNLAVTPANAARRTLAALQTVQAQSAAVVALIDGQPPQALLSGIPVASVSFGQALAAAEYGRGLKKAARALGATAADQSDQLRNRTDSQNVLAVFQARQGMDLREVSTRFYGTQEQWKQLAQYNGISGSKLSIGDTVFVPRLRTPGT